MYVKLFADLLDSSLWAEDSDTRIVWLTLLMLSDEAGMVRATLPGIAHRAYVNVEATEKALELFERPDPNSRTPDNEGRRIERVPGGYSILNYALYRGMKNLEDQRRQTRVRVRKYRAKRELGGGNARVTRCNAPKRHTDTDTDTDTELINNGSCAEPKKDSAHAPPEIAALPLYVNDKRLLKAWAALLPAWKAACPGVDIRQELAKAHAWEIANLRKRKIDKPRFLTAWLNRAQDSQPRPSASGYQPRMTAQEERNYDARKRQSRVDEERAARERAAAEDKRRAALTPEQREREDAAGRELARILRGGIGKPVPDVPNEGLRRKQLREQAADLQSGRQ